MSQYCVRVLLVTFSALGATSLLCGCGGGGGGASSAYTVRALPADGGERGSFAYDINDNGQIAGQDGDCAVVWNADGTKRVLHRPESEGETSYAMMVNAGGFVAGMIAEARTTDPSSAASYQGATWDSNNTCTRLGFPDIPQLPVMPGLPIGINPQGEIVGSAGSKAVYWSSSANQPVALDDAPDGECSIARGINGAGLIVGDALISTPKGDASRGAVWRNDGRLVGLLQPLQNGTESSAHAVNQSGLIVGESRDNEGKCTAVEWTSDGRISQLQGLPGRENTQALDVNDLGQIVGFASNGPYASGMRGYVAVFWDSSGRITALGALPGATGTRASAINNSGQIVGGASDSVASVSKAVIWEPSL